MIDLKRQSGILQFASQLKLTGEFSGEQFILHPFQQKIVSDILCEVDDNGKRVYKEAAIWLPKKNGKTTLISFMVLLALYSSAKGKIIVSAATTREQASLIFSDVAGMVRQNDFLKRKFKIIDSRKRIVDLETGSYYESLTAEADSMDGKRFSLCIMDELHRWKNRDLYDVLRKSMANQESPLLISISTAGDDRTSLGYDVWEYTKKVRDGILEDKTFYPCIFAAEETDPWDSEETWKKANPAYGLFLQPDFLKKEAQRAVDSPSTKSAFLRYHLNLWTDKQDGFFDMSRVHDCTREAPFDLAAADLYLGVDLSRSRDLTSVMELYKFGDQYHLKTNAFLPLNNIKDCEERDKVSYRHWIEQGFLIATPGDIVDFQCVLKRMEEIRTKHPIKSVQIDPYNASMLATELQQRGFEVEYANTFANGTNKPTRELEKIIIAKALTIEANPLLRWNFSNVVVEEDNLGRLRPNKKKSKNKIDCIMATIYALAKAIDQGHLVPKAAPSIYETRGFLDL